VTDLAGIRSSFGGIEWPPVAAGPPAVLAALLAQLDRSQWLSPEEIALAQFHQLVRLAEHCAQQSPAFAQRLERAGLSPAELGTQAGLARLPVLTRGEVQSAGADLYCRDIPPGHLPTDDVKTSGSTGEPVVIRRTAINGFFWSAMAIREHFWHGRDFSKRLCAIRANITEPQRNPHWGQPAQLLFDTGESLVLPINRDASELFEMVADFAPDNLLIYPNTLDAFAAYARETGRGLPSLKHIRSIGETLSPRIRHAAEAALGAKVEDLYSSNELGYIAAQCPESGLYHVMAEDVIVEILDVNGAAWRPGETGRVVITSLHNFAMPLIRYDIGDYAQVGHPCSCGRGLPTLARVAGRERNLIRMPDGSRFWPVIGMLDVRDIAPISQWQLIQTAREAMELRLVSERDLTPEEEGKIRAVIEKALSHPFAIDIRYFESQLPRGANGKFEEFICRVE
jgi:phenylacetate-CoA ligase